MKKVLVILGVIASINTFGQTPTVKTTTTSKFNYRVGIATGLPVDVNVEESRLKTSSTMGEVSYKNTKLSKKITLTANAGYLRFTSTDGMGYAKIPVMVGVRYPINETFYFGASAGPSFYNKKENGTTELVYSPYVGLQVKKISCDFRYLNFTRKDYVQKTIGLVFGYTL